jgi:hypothetical protein
VKVPRPDVVADLGGLTEAANGVDRILAPARLGVDRRQNVLKGGAVRQPLDAPADADDPVVEVVGDLRMVIDARLE